MRVLFGAALFLTSWYSALRFLMATMSFSSEATQDPGT